MVGRNPSVLLGDSVSKMCYVHNQKITILQRKGILNHDTWMNLEDIIQRVKTK